MMTRPGNLNLALKLSADGHNDPTNVKPHGFRKVSHIPVKIGTEALLSHGFVGNTEENFPTALVFLCEKHPAFKKSILRQYLTPQKAQCPVSLPESDVINEWTSLRDNRDTQESVSVERGSWGRGSLDRHD
ncbi:hypothetical protein H671_1g2111 [Cricetulus griseus]|nr:hypothetical protein H671_1g2111 [Cricetulus griseus]